jgi:hypothetical protein
MVSIENELVAKVWPIARFDEQIAGFETLLHSVNIYIQWGRERLLGKKTFNNTPCNKKIYEERAKKGANAKDRRLCRSLEWR